MKTAVSFQGICKSYGAVRANDYVSFAVEAGTVHAVIGENGAGKSTLMRMLAGAELPDRGEILLDQLPVVLSSPAQAARQGIGMVYQDLKVAPALTVWENVVLAFEPRRFGVIDRRRARAEVMAMIERYAMRFAADARVEHLSLSQRQQVEILRLLYRGSSLLILDEPTAVLTPAEVAYLFGAIRLLCAEGKTVLFVSHKLPEILEIADRITVMRNGAAVQTVDVHALDRQRLVQLIVGRDLAPIERTPPIAGNTVLVVEDLSVAGTRIGVRAVSFAVSAGSILGIAGVAGNGQDELFAALTGLAPVADGRIVIDGNAGEIVLDRTPQKPSLRVRQLRDGGVSIIPQDRRGTGSAANQPLWFSMFAGRYWRWVSKLPGLLGPREAKAEARAAIAGFAVKTESINALPSQLSGGNLQKFIVGREMGRRPRLLFAEDPTRGVDIGSSRFIRQQMRRLADGGAAVVLISTDLDELLEIADEIIVLNGGALSGRFDTAGIDREALGRAMISADESAGFEQTRPFMQGMPS